MESACFEKSYIYIPPQPTPDLPVHSIRYSSTPQSHIYPVHVLYIHIHDHATNPSTHNPKLPILTAPLLNPEIVPVPAPAFPVGVPIPPAPPAPPVPKPPIITLPNPSVVTLAPVPTTTSTPCVPLAWTADTTPLERVSAAPPGVRVCEPRIMREEAGLRE